MILIGLRTRIVRWTNLRTPTSQRDCDSEPPKGRYMAHAYGTGFAGDISNRRYITQSRVNVETLATTNRFSEQNCRGRKCYSCKSVNSFNDYGKFHVSLSDPEANTQLLNSTHLSSQGWASSKALFCEQNKINVDHKHAWHVDPWSAVFHARILVSKSNQDQGQVLNLIPAKLMFWCAFAHDTEKNPQKRLFKGLCKGSSAHRGFYHGSGGRFQFPFPVCFLGHPANHKEANISCKRGGVFLALVSLIFWDFLFLILARIFLYFWAFSLFSSDFWGSVGL